MDAVEERLAKVGFSVPAPVPALAAYVPAVLDGDLVFTAGQLPVRGGALLATGRVGGEVDPDLAYECAAQAALNGLGAIRSVVGRLDRVSRVLKVVGYVATEPGFTNIPDVVNGASSLLLTAFGEAGRHARSAVGCSALPLGSPVEIELVVRIGDRA